MVSKTIVILAGPTASGKSSIAMELAQSMPMPLSSKIEIISADSVAVYRHADIGSAKPSQADQQMVRHHLIDRLDPNQRYTAGEFVHQVNHAIEDIYARGNLPILVGGSGFYLKALILGMWGEIPSQPELRKELDQWETNSLVDFIKCHDPNLLERVSENDRYRLIRAVEIIKLSGKQPSSLEKHHSKKPDARFQIFVLNRDPNELKHRIAERVAKMLEQGLVEETRLLAQQWPEAHLLGATGYRQTYDFVRKRTPKGRKLRPGLEGLKDEIVLAHVQLARKQRHWFETLPITKRFLLDQDRDQLFSELKSIYQECRNK